jgi:hypothetical protein
MRGGGDKPEVESVANNGRVYMNLKIIVIVALVGFGGCGQRQKVEGDAPKNSAIGTWELVSKTTTYGGDSVTHDVVAGAKTIKIINATHFAFLTHEVRVGSDTTAVVPVFVAGGGSYTLRDSIYTESLEYCNFREWENHKFSFILKVKGDSLIQSGEEEVEELKIRQTIVEKYIRVKP